jgi:peptide/nickel transport system substrate-binding protein
MRKLGIVLVLLVLVPVVAVFAHNGLWPDQIVFFEEVEQSKVLAMMQTGDVHLYGNSFAADHYQEIVDSGLPWTFSYGSFNEILLNPAVDENGDPYFNDGRFNPFAVSKVRQAMTHLIDRDLIVDELLRGLGVARITLLDPNSPPYASVIETMRALEIQWSYDAEKALELINEGMTEAGAELVGGKWMYDGEPVVLIGIIRVEDERLQIGDYFSNILEDAGFTVDRQYKTAAEAAPIWLLDDPNNGLWNFYTGAWISNLIDRDQGGDYDFMYTARGLDVPLNEAYPITPEADAMFDKLARLDYNSIEERVELLGLAETYAQELAWHQWLFSAASTWATAKGTSVLVDTAAGISGSYLWGHTARFIDEDGAPIAGGTMAMASPSMLTQPWNPVAGSTATSDRMIQRATEDWFLYPDPNTGLFLPHLVEYAECYVLYGTPMVATHDYVTVVPVDEIEVPAHVWCDWDPVNQVFITVGEKFPDGLTARTKTVCTFSDNLFETTWHDSSRFSLADILMRFIMTFDVGKPESAIYDEVQVPSLEEFLQVFKGAFIVNMYPLVIEVYDDRFALDAETQVFERIGDLFWPYYGSGMAPWHTIAVGILAETAREIAFSEDKADSLGVDRMNFLAGPTLQIMTNHLDLGAAAGYIPFEPTLSQYITDAVECYANLFTFYATYGHLWIGNGPMMIDTIDPTAKIIVGKRFDGYIHDGAKWLGFAEPKAPNLDISGPATVAIGAEAEFMIDLTFKGEAYLANDVHTIKYLVIGAEGNFAFSGEGVMLADGQAKVTLSAEKTAQLVEGSTCLEVIAILKAVAKTISAWFSFVADERAEAWRELPAEEPVPELPTYTWDDFFPGCECWPDDPYELGQDIGDLFTYIEGQPDPWEYGLHDGLHILELILDPEGSGLSRCDLNSNGLISLEEVQQIAQESDIDGNGLLELYEIEDDDFRQLAELYDINRNGVVDLDRLVLIEVTDDEEEVNIDELFRCTWGWEEWEPPEGWLELLDADGDGEMEITPDVLVRLKLYPTDEADGLARELLPFTDCLNPVYTFLEMLEQNLHPTVALAGEIGDHTGLDLAQEGPVLAMVGVSSAAPDHIEEIDRQIVALADEIERLERKMKVHLNAASRSQNDMAFWRNEISERENILAISAIIYKASTTLLDIATIISVAKLAGPALKAAYTAGARVVAGEGTKKLTLKAVQQKLTTLLFRDAASKAATREMAKAMAKQFRRQSAEFLRIVVRDIPKEAGKAIYYSTMAEISKMAASELALNVLSMQIKAIKDLDNLLRKMVGDWQLRYYIKQLNSAGIVWAYHIKEYAIKDVGRMALENKLMTLREARKKHTGFPNLTGVWETNYGRMRLYQIGNKVTGTYDHDDGEIEGEFSISTTLVFKWWEKARGKGFDQAALNERGIGYFNVSRDENVLTGKWMYYEGRKWTEATWTCRRRWNQTHQIGTDDLMRALKWEPIKH